MNKLSNIISHFAECYKFDFKGIRINNFLSSSCENRFIPSHNTFFHSENKEILIEEKWALKASKNLYLNAKTKTLFAGSYFIKGIQNNLGKKSTSAVPLYIHELTLKQIADHYFVEIIETYINPECVEQIKKTDSSISLTNDDFHQQLPQNPTYQKNRETIINFMQTHMKKWKTKHLSSYENPDFNHLDSFSLIKEGKPGNLTFYPGLMFGLFKKTSGSVGIINELQELSSKSIQSSLLEKFFLLQPLPQKEVKERTVYVPASLSAAQEEAILRSELPISMIIGPPGTGKSYTISSLAIDTICKNESVLIVTKNPEASRVISSFIVDEFKLQDSIVRAETRRYKRSLIAKIKRAQKYSFTNPSKEEPLYLLNYIEERIRQLEYKISEIEEFEIKWGKHYSEYKKSLFGPLKKQYVLFQKKIKDSVWKLAEEYRFNVETKIDKIKDYVDARLKKQLSKAIKKNNIYFNDLIDSLKEKNLTSLDKKLNEIEFARILEAFPLWTTTVKNISEVFPLKKQLFDLVIVDEATQCDIASLIPIIYRAKRLVIVGDPQQLRHMSFLSEMKQNSFKAKYNLSDRIPHYRKESAIDWVNSQLTNHLNSTYLDEHFRSRKGIINFSNKTFYNNLLKVIRSNPINNKQVSLFVEQIKGKREKNGVNVREANELIKYLIELLNNFKNASLELIPTIGIISPFTQQVKYIKSLIKEQIPIEFIKKHQLLIGTPHHFQGAERHVVLISFVIDKNFHFGTTNYLNQEDVFNVSITRARDIQVVFTSIKKERLPVDSLLRKYLESIDSFYHDEETPEENNLFQTEIKKYLTDLGCEKFYTSLTVSGVSVDLVAIKNQKFYCFDLIGYPGKYIRQTDFESIKMLQRMNTKIFFIPYSSWYLETKKVKENISKFISS